MKTCLNLLAAIALAGASFCALAQGYPVKSVRILVTLPPGSPAEIPQRGMAEALGKSFGQPFVIENRPGADGFIAAEACARAPADGYTLCGLTQTHVVLNPHFHAKMPYDPERDFVPIGYLGTFTGALVVSAKLPANTMRELIELAKTKPESVSFATLGGTSMGSMYTAWLRHNTGAVFHPIPYKSTLEGLHAVIAGDVDAVVIAVGSVISPTRAGKVKALAVTTSTRWPALPDVPTLNEAGIGLPVSFNTWVGLFAPAGTPAEVVSRLNGAVAKVLADPAHRAKFVSSIGLELIEPTPSTLAEVAAFIKRDREVIAKGIAEAGIKKQ